MLNLFFHRVHTFMFSDISFNIFYSKSTCYSTEYITIIKWLSTLYLCVFCDRIIKYFIFRFFPCSKKCFPCYIFQFSFSFLSLVLFLHCKMFHFDTFKNAHTILHITTFFFYISQCLTLIHLIITEKFDGLGK